MLASYEEKKERKNELNIEPSPAVVQLCFSQKNIYIVPEVLSFGMANQQAKENNLLGREKLVSIRQMIVLIRKSSTASQSTKYDNSPAII